VFDIVQEKGYGKKPKKGLRILFLPPKKKITNIKLKQN